MRAAYQSSGSALRDVGRRVLADAAISYEADAVLLVEISGATRTITPIIKPPRPAHLPLERRYAAEGATLDPALAAPDLTLLVEQLRSAYKRVRQLGGNVPELTAARVAAMGQAELEVAPPHGKEGPGGWPTDRHCRR